MQSGERERAPMVGGSEKRRWGGVKKGKHNSLNSKLSALTL